MRTSVASHRLIGTATVALLLTCGCASAPQPTPQPTPAPQPQHMVGGPCSYTSEASDFTVKRVILRGEQASIFFEHPANPQYVLVADTTATNAQGLAAGQRLSGTTDVETKGTCTPRIYRVTLNGNVLDLAAQQATN